MSGFTKSFNQPPCYYTVADYRDTDTFLLDCSNNMLARGTAISSVGSGVVTRSDGLALDTGDYSVGPATLVASGTVVTLQDGSTVTIAQLGTWLEWTGTGGIAGVGYYVMWPISLPSGILINRTVGINVSGNVG
jgi:hypothetical protein